ncbi:MAG: cell division protein ZapE [Steroidobacteraceae bacterium]
MNDAGSLARAYHESLQRHGYSPDRSQLHAVGKLDALHRRLHSPAPGGWFARTLATLRGPGTEPARGLYLWGGVGRGKTFLMDLFHTELRVPARRDHFHRFMKDVHERLAGWRHVEDPLSKVAGTIAEGARVLCLDELFVSDIADAMILSGLFAALDARGVTLVFTSNTPPSGLYRDGLQRARFLPAIALIESRCDVVNVDSGTDYRLRQLEKAPLYFDAASAGVDARLMERFEAIAGAPGQTGGVLEVEGRRIQARRLGPGVAWFDFAGLCEGPRGTADYVEIARDFHTVFVSGVPVFDSTRDNEARRFIALVDEFYDRSVKLVLAAAAMPDALYRGERLAFEFDRTRSRLAEMQTHAYLARAHRP